MKLPTWKELVARLLLVALGCAAGLACAELALRWYGYDHPTMQAVGGGKLLPIAGFPTKEMYTFDPVTGFALVPNIHDADRGITTDAKGFRITSRPFDSSRPSIVFLGDSTVFGYLSRDEDSYPFLISKMPEFAGYNIVNMGVPAYSLAHVRHVMADKLPALKPRLVVVQFLWPWQPWKSYQTSPDAWKNLDMPFYGRSFARRATYQPETSTDPEHRYALSLLLEDLKKRLRFGRQIRDNFSRPTEIFDFQVSEPVEREVATDYIREFRAAAKPLHDVGADVIFYIHPFQYTLFRDEYKRLGVLGRKMLVDQLGAVYLGGCILEQHAKRPSETLFIDAEHMTKPGNVVLAGCVADAVKKALRH